MGLSHSQVQARCLPYAKMGNDVICQAKAGNGKTAVFVITILQQMVVVEGQVSAVIVVPTRELTLQVCFRYH